MFPRAVHAPLAGRRLAQRSRSQSAPEPLRSPFPASSAGRRPSTHPTAAGSARSSEAQCVGLREGGAGSPQCCAGRRRGRGSPFPFKYDALDPQEPSGKADGSPGPSISLQMEPSLGAWQTQRGAPSSRDSPEVPHPQTGSPPHPHRVWAGTRCLPLCKAEVRHSKRAEAL